jgi:hypothetical protein
MVVKKQQKTCHERCCPTEMIKGVESSLMEPDQKSGSEMICLNGTGSQINVAIDFAFQNYWENPLTL